MSDQGSSAPIADSSAHVESAQEDISTETAGEQSSENSAEASPEEIKQALEDGEISQKEAQKLIKKFQLKVRGKTVEREIDLSDDDFIKNQLQLAEMSKLSMQESAELKKAYGKELERLKANPWQVLEELGFSADELAESRIQQRIEEMKKSPEQLEKEQYMRELEEARSEARRLKEEKETIEMQKLQEQASVQINDEITTALAAHKTLPNSPYVVKRVADSMLWAMNNGFEDVTAADVVPLVESEMRAEMSQLFDQVPEEVLEQLVGKKNIERMRQKRVAAVKSAPSVNSVKQTVNGLKAEPKQAEKRPVRSRDFFKSLGK